MQKIYLFGILLILSSQLSHAQFAGGAGTASNPFLVSTAEHLNNVRNHLNTTSLVYFRQTANIDLSSFANWMPIGGGGTTNIFNGVYDGNGHIITNLTINRPDTDNVGLFGLIGPNDVAKISATSIINLGLRNVNVVGRSSVGSLVGRVSGNEVTVIRNCYVIGGTVMGDSITGGLIGANNSYITLASFEGRKPIIRRSYANVSVSFSGAVATGERFGGLVGCNFKGVIENSHSLSSVTVTPTAPGSSMVGGLAGSNDGLGVIDRSFSVGAVTINANVSLAGGLLGTQGTSGHPGTVTNSFWDTQTSGLATSAGGAGRTTPQMKTQGNYTNWDFAAIWSIIEGVTYPYLTGMDLNSGFDVALTIPGSKVAGQSFDLTITNAVNSSGTTLNGSFRVRITTNIVEENGVPDGVILDALFTFNNGIASVTGVVCSTATTHTLTVNVETIPSAETLTVIITPAPASLLEISQQPQDVYSGNFDNNPVSLGTIVVVSTDQFGNNSTVGLASGQMVTASIENDSATGGNTILGGTTQVAIHTGTATFNNLTINNEGTGFTLRFASVTPANLGWIISEPFNVQNIVNRSGFDITAPSPQFQQVMFTANITNATGSSGAPLTGNRNVQIVSSIEGMIFNQSINFSSGIASLQLSIEEIGIHSLTATVEGVATSEIFEVTVVADQSGFTLDPIVGNRTAGIPFDLNIRGARGWDGAFITSARVIVSSNISGQGVVFDQVVNTFDAVGDAVIPVTLTMPSAPGSHILTVTIQTITLPRSVSVVVIPNPSDFTLTLPTTPVDAGDPFQLQITNASNVNGFLNGNFNVRVSSDREGITFDQLVAFTDGAATFSDTLDLAAVHFLSVSITGIVPQNSGNVTVIPNVAVALQIVSQDLGRTGTSAGTPVVVGTVTLRTIDKVGNPSIRGLSGTQNVVATLQVDGSANRPATLGGNLTRDIMPSGTVIFDDLSLNRNGTGYVIRFTSSSPVNLGFIDTNPFNMAGVEDLRSFKVAHPGPQVIGVNFTVTIYDARNPDGSLRNGSFPITIVSATSDPVEPDFLHNSNAAFVNGVAEISTTGHYTETGVRRTHFIIENHRGSQRFLDILVVATDLSGFEITNPGAQNAGVPFNLSITNARDKAGNLLNGRNHMVTLTTNNSSEGINGLLVRDSISFTGGNGVIPNVILNRVGTQNLTVAIDWITLPVTLTNLTVNPGPATTFLIVTQPTGGAGNLDNVPVSTGSVVLNFRDQFGNNTNHGLTGTFTVTAQIASGTSGATLGGTTTRNIVNGVVTFDDLTIDRNGTYTLRFIYNGSPVFAPLISAPFNMTNIENLSAFEVAHPGKQYQSIPFDLLISNARSSNGTLMGDSINVSITSDQTADGEVFNGPVSFTAGSTAVNIVLNTIALHDLTVSVAGVLTNVVVQDVEVAPDLSGFTLALNPPAGPFYQSEPFGLVIDNATNRDGGLLAGAFNVIISSNIDGNIFTGDLGFVSGRIEQSIVLNSAGTHTLTVTLAGITPSQTIVVPDVLANQSGFDLALEVPGDKVAGEDFNLSITNALNLVGDSLSGDQHRIIVISNLSDTVYNQAINMFTNGSASVPLNLTLAGNHTLTVSIAGITTTRTVVVNVIPAAVSKLVITTHPAGGVGNLDNLPVFIGNVVVGTFDSFDNPSVSGLSGTQTVTATIANDPSAGAILGGTSTVDISTGTATFSNLTIDKEGIGYTLSIAYNGNPALALVITNPFDISNIYVTYTIELNVADPYSFGQATVGYAPITPLTVTITRTGSGIITGLTTALHVNDVPNFTITQPLLATLDGTNPATTFTVVPNTGLLPGLYVDTVIVAANNGINETFVVSFTVLHSYLISVSSPNIIGGLLNFGTGVEGLYTVPADSVTITRTGTGIITNLLVSLSGPAAASFTVTQPPITTLDENTISTSFTVVPNAGLTAGLYAAVVAVTADNGVSQTFNVQFTVVLPHSISLTPVGDFDFGIHPLGYSPIPEHTITITNTGGLGLTGLSVTMSGGAGSAFVAGTPVPDVLPTTGATATFSVVPQNGLPVGTYSETVTVTATELTQPATFNVLFRVSQVFTWVGNTPDWHISQNWIPETIPAGQVYITIPAAPAGGNYPVISGQNVSVYNMTVAAGANITVASGRRLTVQGTGVLTIENNAQLNATGDIRILSGGRMVMRPGARGTVTGTFDNQAGLDGLTLESSSSTLAASLIIGSTGVQATVQRWMSGRIFNVISPPVSGDRIEDFVARNPISRNTALQVFAMQIYNEVGAWSPFFPFTITGEMLPARAYSIRLGPSGGAAVSFRGTLLTNQITMPVTRQLFGWNGVGNPFTASIGITQAATSGFLNDNLTQLDPEFAGVWVYDHSILGYRIINNVPQGGLVQDFLALGQGFIIKTRTGGGNIVFNPSLRRHEQTTFLRSAPAKWHNIRLAARIGNSESTFRFVSTFIGFNSSMTAGLDVSFDGGMFDPNPNLRIFTRMVDGSRNLDLEVQALPDNFNNTVIPVGFVYPAGGQVMFTTHALNLPYYVDALLEDRTLDRFTNLASSDYTVTLPAGSQPTGRFFIHLREREVFYPVNFGINSSGAGVVRASVELNEINSGDQVRRNSRVVFTATPNLGFRLTGWNVNGNVIAPSAGGDFVVETLQNATTVTALFEGLTVDVQENELHGFRIFAHDGRIYIQGPIKDNMRAALYDINGRRVISRRLREASTYSFSVEELITGVYVVRLTGGERPINVKLVLE